MFDTFDFSCAAASIADFPPFSTHLQGFSHHQGLWEGEKPGRGEGDRKEPSNLSLKAKKRVTSIEIAGT